MIEKIYKLSHLCTDSSFVDWRINEIMHLTHHSIAPIYFEKNNDKLIRKTKRIYIKHISYGKLSEEQINQLSNFLDEIHKINLVHGDINKKNLFLDKNDNIILLDWEPCLNQIINNKYSLMGTPPWIDIEDKINQTLTIRTDLLCFYRIISNNSLSFFKSKVWFNLLNSSLLNHKPFTYLTNQFFLKELI
jgi:serine/threonine protein kinase